MELKSYVPDGPLEKKWDKHRFDMKLVNPANKRKYTRHCRWARAWRAPRRPPRWPNWATTSNASASRTAPRRAHSIAAQGGINAAKNYQNDGDSVCRLFYDTIKGGDFRAAKPMSIAWPQVSVNIIDQCVAQGVPFAREYGGLLANRSFGGAQVSRTFYARGQTGQQLLLGAYQALERQIGLGKVKMYPRSGDARPRGGGWPGPRHHHPQPGHRPDLNRTSAMPWFWRTGGYGNVFYLSTNAKGCNVTATGAPTRRAQLFANPCYHPDPSHLHSGHRRLPVEADADVGVLRNDGRIWVPQKKGDTASPGRDSRRRSAIITWSASIPATATWLPATSRRGRPKKACDDGRGVGPTGLGVYLDFADAIKRLGRQTIAEKYGNLFDMYETHHRRGPLQDRRCGSIPASPLHHGRTLGGLQSDEHDPGLFVLGEANFSDHGANRLGASALMQGLADGYFIVPYTIGELSRQHQAGQGDDRSSRVRRRPRPPCRPAREQALSHQGQAHGRPRSTASSGR